MNGFASSRLLILALLLTLAASAFAQQSSVSIKGTITDQLGGLVVGASVVAKDGKGNPVSVTTNDDGIYAPGLALTDRKQVRAQRQAPVTSSPGWNSSCS